jgi:hypothetical protein
MSSDNVAMLARALEWQPEDMERVRRSPPPTTWWRAARPVASIISLAVLICAILYSLALAVQFLSH